jgi:hypothetical protein
VSLRDLVAARLGGLPSLLGGSIVWRQRISNPGADPVVWSPWTNATGKISAEENDIDRAEGTRTERLAQRAELVVAESLDLPLGSLVRSAQGGATDRTWSVDARLAAPAGQRRYRLQRHLPREIGSNRGSKT